MSPLDHLLAEQIPSRPESAEHEPRTYQQYWTAAEQDAHWADLCAAVGTPNKPRPRRPPERTTPMPTTKAPKIRVTHRPAGWVMPDYTDLHDCTTNHLPANTGQLPCTAPAVWRVVEDHGMHLTLSFWCDDDLPAEHRPSTGPAATPSPGQHPAPAA